MTARWFLLGRGSQMSTGVSVGGSIGLQKAIRSSHHEDSKSMSGATSASAELKEQVEEETDAVVTFMQTTHTVEQKDGNGGTISRMV